MKVLIVTSCTGQKTVSHPAGLTCVDFAQAPEHIRAREAALAEALTPARDLYSGQQHARRRRAGRQDRHRPLRRLRRLRPGPRRPQTRALRVLLHR